MACTVSIDAVKTKLHQYIDRNKKLLKTIGTSLWQLPECSYQEHHAHTLITDLLEENGFTIERNYLSETGFRASLVNGPNSTAADNTSGNTQYLHMCLICEYDAIEGMGHVAGHNLSSQASITTALALAHCMQDNIIRGKITVLGTPAESTCGGTKFDMIDAGVFEHVDFAMMVMPYNENVLAPKNHLLVTMTVKYTGKAAHASAYPWEGKNALECAIACYTNLALVKQNIKKTWSINAVITNGGSHPNIIPAESELKLFLRAPDHAELMLLQQQCTPCIEAAAQFNRCEVEWNINYKPYQPMQHSPHICEIFQQHAEQLDINFTKDPEIINHHIASTDFGNISQIVPSIYPAYDIGCVPGIHTTGFHDAANENIAHDNTFVMTKALSTTAAQLLLNPSLMDSIRSDYQVTRTISGCDLLTLQKVEELQ